MTLRPFLAATAAAAALAVVPAALAQTTTINLNRSENTTDQPFAAFTESFILPTAFTNASLNITSLIADDAAVVSLNGNRLFGTGINGPGTGNFYFTAGGTSVPFTFAANGTGGVFSGPFQAGTNTFTIFVNNNNAGINPGNGPLTGGPGQLQFVGNVTYNVAAAVPEPATWAMMLVGFGMIGFGMRRRKSDVRTTVRFA